MQLFLVVLRCIFVLINEEMDMLGILKVLHVFLLATVKYFLSFPYALVIGLEQKQAILVVTVGGIVGFVFFYFLSGILINNIAKIEITLSKLLPSFMLKGLRRLKLSFNKWKKDKITFNKKNRLLVRLRAKYGLWGIIISTPIILSIPLGAFLLNKYYSRHKHAFSYMIISIVGWALIFSAIVIILPQSA